MWLQLQTHLQGCSPSPPSHLSFPLHSMRPPHKTCLWNSLRIRCRLSLSSLFSSTICTSMKEIQSNKHQCKHAYQLWITISSLCGKFVVWQNIQLLCIQFQNSSLGVPPAFVAQNLSCCHSMHNKWTCLRSSPTHHFWRLHKHPMAAGARRRLLFILLHKLHTLWGFTCNSCRILNCSCLGISKLPCVCRQQQTIACLDNWRERVRFSAPASSVLGFGSSPTPWSLVVSLDSWVYSSS